MAVLYVDHCTPQAAASSCRKMLGKTHVARLPATAGSGLCTTPKTPVSIPAENETSPT